MVVFVIGANHKTASMGVLEKYFYGKIGRQTCLSLSEKDCRILKWCRCKPAIEWSCTCTDQCEIVMELVKSFLDISDVGFMIILLF